jgi:hypothetical protein
MHFDPNGRLTMPAGNVLLYAQWTLNPNTAYIVQHYLVDAAGNAALQDTEYLSGTTGAAVSAVSKVYENYTYNPDYAGTALRGTIAGDGSLVLSLYYIVNPAAPAGGNPPAGGTAAATPVTPPTPPATTITPTPTPTTATPATPDPAPAVTPAPTGTEGEENTEIGEVEPPLASGAAWPLINLLFAIVTIIVMAALWIAYASRRKKEDETLRKHLGARVLSIVVAAASVIAFFLTEDVSLPIGMTTDKWTILMAAILVVQVVVAILSRTKSVVNTTEKA